MTYSDGRAFALAALLTVIAACSKQGAPVSDAPAVRTRVSARACPVVGPSPAIAPNERGSCTSDADCPNGRQGRCKAISMGHGMVRATCTYDACASDADCPSGTLCLCGASYEGRNACMPADCHDDADCPAGRTCENIPPNATGSLIPTGRQCHTKADTCSKPESCGAGKTCAYQVGSSRWECVEMRYPPPG